MTYLLFMFFNGIFLEKNSQIPGTPPAPISPSIHAARSPPQNVAIEFATCNIYLPSSQFDTTLWIFNGQSSLCLEY